MSYGQSLGLACKLVLTIILRSKRRHPSHLPCPFVIEPTDVIPREFSQVDQFSLRRISHSIIASNRAEIYFVNNNNGFGPFTLCSAMSPPSAPSQPPLNEAYDQPSNPINKNPSEANSSHLLLGPNVETRKAQDVTVEATPTALGYGVRDSSGDRRDEVRAKC